MDGFLVGFIALTSLYCFDMFGGRNSIWPGGVMVRVVDL